MTDLREFSDQYLVRDDGSEDGVWSQEIPGGLGVIYSHGENGSLAVLAQSAAAIRGLATMGLKVKQRGDTEMVFVFDPKQLEKVAAIIHAKRRAKQ